MLDADIALPLAATSDAVADALEAGDVCGAAVRADELRAQVIAAINDGDVPAAFQEALLGRANELRDAVNCPQPAPEPEDEPDDERVDAGERDEDEGEGRREKAKGKKAKKGKKNPKASDAPPPLDEQFEQPPLEEGEED